MNIVFLTQDDGMIIGLVAKLLGKIMDVIFNVIDFIGIPNIGLAIILFTVVVNLLMLPLTLKQQKFSKLSAKMNPELQAIRDKYKGRQDNESMIAQNQEIQMVYNKYGVSPSGSCVQLLIQMPILFALYRVIAAIPAYVGKIKETFTVLAEKIIETDNGQFLLNSEIDTINSTIAMYGRNIKEGNMTNGIIDVLNKLSSADLGVLAEHYQLTDLVYEGELILSNSVTTGLIDTYNNFCGLNIGNSPSFIVKSAIETGSWGLVLGAIAIPVLSAVTQWINSKLIPQQNTENRSQEENAMASSMKTMNTIMPIMSAWFCYTLPCGMGLYWIAGAVVRGILQVITNKHLDKMDFDEIIKKNEVKSAEKLEKMKRQQEMINAYANMNTKNIQSRANINAPDSKNMGTSKVSSNSQAASQKGNSNNGSLMSKANMVRDFNERNNKN